MNTFEEAGLEAGLLKAVQELGFDTPTPIQEKTIPQLLSSKKNIIALAQTGTGKTAAFGLPSIQLSNLNDRNTQTIVLCPTRELCLQINKDMNDYAKFTPGIRITAIYGGAPIQPQIKALGKGAHIVIGTPGRTMDLINRKKLVLDKVARVVLDEADEMLSMGFKEDLDAILAETPKDKQTLLFSATMSKAIRSITRKYMDDAVELSAARVNMGADNVSHYYYMVQARDRYEVLKRIADMHPEIYGIVFCRTRRETKEIANKLMQDGYNADALHGDLSQAQRDEVMGRFRKNQLQLLVATDVAARGLDVNDLTHIINYNLPDDNEVYVHRSGRTGRAGKSGQSIVIVHSRETGKIRAIEKKFKINFTRLLVPSGSDICNKQLLALIDKIEKVNVNEQQIEPFLPVIYDKLKSMSKEDVIKHFVSTEFNRFFEYYKNARDINISEHKRADKYKRNERNDRRDRNDRRNRNNSRDRIDRDDRNERNSFRDRDKRSDIALTRLFINVGSKNKLVPLRLIGLINEALRSGNAEIGKIEIMKTFSFFEIESSMESKLIASLNGMDFEGIPLQVEISKEKPAGAAYPKRNKSKKTNFDSHRNKRRNNSRESRGRKNRKKW